MATHLDQIRHSQIRTHADAVRRDQTERHAMCALRGGIDPAIVMREYGFEPLELLEIVERWRGLSHFHEARHQLPWWGGWQGASGNGRH